VKLALGILALALLAGSAKADEVYTYTGPAPADLSGSFTTPMLLSASNQTYGTVGTLNALFTPVTSWSFTDGPQTWTPTNSSFAGGAYINPDGTFAVWSFDIQQNGLTVAYSQTSYTNFYNQDDTPVGDSWVANQNLWDKPKGSWTMADPPSSLPEPGTLALVGLGLALISLISFRVKA
jgi:hypothetical protein